MSYVYLRFRVVSLLLLFVLIVAGCGVDRPAARDASPPADARATSPPATPTPSRLAESATAPAEPTEVAAATPTSEPTITPAPTATPFPLEAGWWDDAVCYEVFVRSFYDSDGDGIGDFNGLIQKLDYISDGDPNTESDLSATCIWLMPIMESPSYHGYDVVDYYNIDQEYGSNDDFKRLIEEAHKRGINVIVDLVLNHTSSEHPWFQEALRDPDSPYRDWYIWSEDDPGYSGPWSQQVWHRSPVRDEYYYGIFWEGMPDLNYRNPKVTEEAHKISAFWLNQMGADGFRLDAIKHLIENGRIQENTPETHAWLRDYRDFLQESAPQSFTIGEIFGANPLLLEPYYPDQLDKYFLFEVGEKTIGAAGSGAAESYLQAVEIAYDELPYQRWAPFLTNHDQDRVMSVLGDDTGKAKIAVTALLTLPGLPFIYYGEEIGMLGTKPDERIRTPMQWSGEEHGGFTTGEPWQSFQPNYQEVNVAAQDDDPDSLLNHYRRLIRLHTTSPALAHGSFTPLTANNYTVAAFVRQMEDEAILVVLNFGQDAAEDVALSIEQSDLSPGHYSLQPLLGDQAGAELSVGDGGMIADYVPLQTLAPRTGYIFRIEGGE